MDAGSIGTTGFWGLCPLRTDGKPSGRHELHDGQAKCPFQAPAADDGGNALVGGTAACAACMRTHRFSRGAHSDRLKNAALACRSCNQDKGSMTVREYLAELEKRKPRGKRADELNKARASCTRGLLEGRPPTGSLRYCAWAGSMRRRVERALFGAFGEVECASGGRT